MIKDDWFIADQSYYLIDEYLIRSKWNAEICLNALFDI